VEWLNPASSKSRELMLHAGEPFRFALPTPAATAEFVLPGGTRETVTPGQDGEVVFGDTSRQGTYRMRAGTREVAFCVNVLDAAESNTKPREELRFGKFNTVSATAVSQASVEIWRWIAAG